MATTSSRRKNLLNDTSASKCGSPSSCRSLLTEQSYTSHAVLLLLSELIKLHTWLRFLSHSTIDTLLTFAGGRVCVCVASTHRTYGNFYSYTIRLLCTVLHLLPTSKEGMKTPTGKIKGKKVCFKLAQTCSYIEPPLQNQSNDRRIWYGCA